MIESDILSDTFSDIPSAKITITYPNGVDVEFGQKLTPTEVKEQPQVLWEADPSKFYTLMMYDPDEPSRQDQHLAEVKHWLVVNIRGCDLTTGEVISEYVGVKPSKGTGFHRYIFLVYEYEKEKEFDESKSPKNSNENRLNWSMLKFKGKYDLGDAHAGNYFMAQWEPFVDEIKEGISDDY